MSQKEPDEIGRYHTIKLIYPMAMIRSLPLDQTFEQQDIPNGAQLVLLGQRTFAWDANLKGSNITVTNNLTAAF